MTKALVFMAAMIGGGIGWWLGSFIGIMTAFMVSVVGTAVGVYAARQISAEYIT
jgi:hypothetical protein